MFGDIPTMILKALSSSGGGGDGNGGSNKRKTYMIIAVQIAISFAAGIYASPSPEKESFCREIVEESERLDKKNKYLEEKVALLNTQLVECQDGCSTRIREELDNKEVECVRRTGKKIKDLKKSFTDFKCTTCKKIGKCK